MPPSNSIVVPPLALFAETNRQPLNVIAVIVPVVMFAPLMVVCPAVDRLLNVTYPVSWMPRFEIATSFCPTRAEIFDAVCSSVEMSPSAFVMRLASDDAVRSRLEMFPSASVTRVDSPATVADSVVISPSAFSMRASKPDTVWDSWDRLPSASAMRRVFSSTVRVSSLVLPRRAMISAFVSLPCTARRLSPVALIVTPLGVRSMRMTYDTAPSMVMISPTCTPLSLSM